MKLGSRSACIVTNGVLFHTNSKAYTQLRRELVENQRLEAIIYMPSGAFKPYSDVSTAVLVFAKTDAGGTDNAWLCNMEGDGFTLDDRRDEDAKHNDIPDIFERWANLGNEAKRERTEKSFLVPKRKLSTTIATLVLTSTPKQNMNGGGADDFLDTQQRRKEESVIATDLEFSRWGGVFGDDQMAVAVIDRVVHHGRLVQFRRESYRARHAFMQEG